MENVRKQRDLKLVRNDKQRNYLASEPDYNTTKCFSENLVAIEIDKTTNLKMNKLVYLGLSILDITTITVYEWLFKTKVWRQC